MNFIRTLLNTSEKEELVTIPSGAFFLKRSPLSVKGQSECLFKDAVATLRRTSNPFNYQLAIQRVYEEGEEALEGTDGGDGEGGRESSPNDEWAFLLDSALHLTYTANAEEAVVIVWRDIDGDPGDHFEFVCDKTTRPKLYDQFDITARRCQYERKYNKSYEKASDEDLEEFDFEPDVVPVIEQNVIKSETTIKPETLTETETETPIKKEAEKEQNVPETPIAESTPEETPKETESKTPSSYQTTKPEITIIEPVEGTKTYNGEASLHLYDSEAGVFVEQLKKAEVSIYDQGNFEYWLEVDSDAERHIGMSLSNDMNPVFNYDHLSFIFNFFAETAAFSWLLKFPSFEDLEKFQEHFMESLWETNNKTKWTKVKPDDREFLADAFHGFSIEDEENEEEEEDEEEEDDVYDTPSKSIKKGLQYSDGVGEYDDNDVKRMKGKGINKELAVGHVNDRTYVVRDNMLGVFKQTDDDDLEFQTTIENISTTKGKSLMPSKIMLHTQDKSILLQDPENLGSLYRMDLERGEVVEEWNVSDSHKVNAFAPTSKYAQSTGEQTIVGASDTGIFKIDPRLSGTKLVDSQLKNYASKMKFSALATTEQGHLAVANSKGEIRLYDRLGINAKTSLPAMGDEIIGIDVSADGKWILATCKTYLLLIDAGQENGKTGFVKSFGKDVKPRPKRLQISPQHLAQMQMETGKPLSFTIARFNAGQDTREQSIVCSSGPFVITWSLKKLMRGDAKDAYLIQRYSDVVTADNFKYGSDKNVIVALADDVGMVDRRTFHKPTHESLATPRRRIQPLPRNSIVNSPY
ncbi:uncharacterized protein SAPINGB_P000498 [Magnusiomyces paraingens]|uniref:Vacuolar import/degradation Vid27 C-terminal domain-containing protein n=1 Tax=Magnusiomyces paraingens TaxID=2606893 RepID=A0A5E8AZM5_9ASCO|nr:uncharacterized protein SAPINGB_P000498 [Saprochaete ingens]VVT44684.1 unnamed protein product [Saprochaete ingens]